MNKRLYLASSINRTAKSIAEDIGGDVSQLKLAFLDTAAEVEEGDKDWLENDKQSLIDAGFDLFEYTITDKSYEDLKKDLLSADIIHINGGNTFYLLQQSRKSGFDGFVKKHLEAGKIFIGSSAGSIIVGPSISHLETLDNISKAPELTDLNGFGLIDITVFPHWGSSLFPFDKRSEALKTLYKYYKKIVLLSDNQYIKFDAGFIKIVNVNDRL